MILDVRGPGLEVSDGVRVDARYRAPLRVMTSPYVEKVHL
jgi:predicted amino acid racemase